MNHSDERAINLAKQFNSFSIAQSHQGIVSPCSSCLNQRSVTGLQNRPFCPRRSAVVSKQQLDNQNVDSSHYNLLVLTGTSSGLQDDGTKPLANPVYDSSSNSILVWVATFKDNGPVIAADGTVLSPNINDPSFSSDWIKCQSFPFTPREHEASYFQKGCLMPGDQVEVSISPNQQITAQSNGSYNSLPISGTITKFNIIGQFPLQPVNKDLCVSGA